MRTVKEWSAVGWARFVVGVLALGTIVASEALSWGLSGLVMATLGTVAGWVAKDPEALARSRVEPQA